MMQKTKRERSKNLGDTEIEKIVGILDGWSGKLTWDKLLDEIQIHLKQHYTRQTLAKHTRIKSAYDLTKERISEVPKESTHVSPEVTILKQKIERLEAKNTRLQRENQDLLAQFARWAYNSYAKGVTKEDLDKPLPKNDRS